MPSGVTRGRLRCGFNQARRPPLRRVLAFFFWGVPSESRRASL
jgi:hypothetical protein